MKKIVIAALLLLSVIGLKTVPIKENTNTIKERKYLAGNDLKAPSRYTGVIYRYNDKQTSNKRGYGAEKYITNINQLTKDVDYITEADYPTYSERVNYFGNKYYLKHDIVRNEIIDTYVCFVEDKEYCLKGGDYGQSFPENTQVIKTYQEKNNLNIESNPMSAKTGCRYENSNSLCYGGQFYYAYAYTIGVVYVANTPYEHCHISIDGFSTCTK